VPVAQLIEMFLAAWGEGRWIDVGRPDQPRESHTLRLNVDKALWELGWRPRWNVRRAVTETARWHRRFAAQGGAMRDVSLATIADYENDLPARRD
jgi:CDP-glucose 4,6-dehydratase